MTTSAALTESGLVFAHAPLKIQGGNTRRQQAHSTARSEPASRDNSALRETRRDSAADTSPENSPAPVSTTLTVPVLCVV